MNENIKNILTDGGEIIIDSLLQNELVREIPIFGTSLNMIQEVQSLRDKSYLNKIKVFVENVGGLSEKQKVKLISESRKDKKRRAKFGDALFTSIEQSDSLVKIEYLAASFEAFLNNDIDDSELRQICHAIKNIFLDDLIEIVETKNPLMIPFSILSANVFSGLSYVGTKGTLTAPLGNSSSLRYELSSVAMNLRNAWSMYKGTNNK